MRRRCVLWVALATNGCNFSLPEVQRQLDAGPDAPPIASCTTWQPFLSTIDPCSAAWGTPAPLVVTSGTGVLDTQTGVLNVGGSSRTLPGAEGSRGTTTDDNYRLFNLSSLEIGLGAKLTFSGERDALFLVHGHVSLSGVIDASALGTPEATAPGGNPRRCVLSGGAGLSAASDSGGGGGGGAYGSAGARGGDAAGSGAPGGPVNNAGFVWHGGCSGGAGDRAGGQPGGRGGTGGGAIAISARGDIRINNGAALRANGAPGSNGGYGALGAGGGGGGGAGGGILLDGFSIVINGRLCANGGAGGGGGGEVMSGYPGAPTACSQLAAEGGDGGGNEGGRGGDGATANLPAAVGANQASTNGGGGGGGGGVGKILLRLRNGSAPAIDPVAIITPMHQVL